MMASGRLDLWQAEVGMHASRVQGAGGRGRGWGARGEIRRGQSCGHDGECEDGGETHEVCWAQQVRAVDWRREKVRGSSNLRGAGPGQWQARRGIASSWPCAQVRCGAAGVLVHEGQQRQWCGRRRRSNALRRQRGSLRTGGGATGRGGREEGMGGCGHVAAVHLLGRAPRGASWGAVAELVPGRDLREGALWRAGGARASERATGGLTGATDALCARL